MPLSAGSIITNGLFMGIMVDYGMVPVPNVMPIENSKTLNVKQSV